MKDTLEEFKKTKLKLQALIGKELNDDEFLKCLLKAFKRYDEVFKISDNFKEIT